MSEVKKQQEIKIMNVADLENLSLSVSSPLSLFLFELVTLWETSKLLRRL